jgi:hypothetical protein
MLVRVGKVRTCSTLTSQCFHKPSHLQGWWTEPQWFNQSGPE